jgi:hypothetical protein
MRMVRTILASRKGRIVLLVVAAIIGWQVWLTLAAPGKIAAGIPPDVNRVDVRVLLPFVPERFHVQEMQRFGRVSGTRDNTIEVRGVNRGDLHALARPFWVRQVEPLEQGG